MKSLKRYSNGIVLFIQIGQELRVMCVELVANRFLRKVMLSYFEYS